MNRGGSEFWRLLHVGECGSLDGLREKAGQDSIYVGAIMYKHSRNAIANSKE